MPRDTMRDNSLGVSDLFDIEALDGPVAAAPAGAASMYFEHLEA